MSPIRYLLTGVLITLLPSLFLQDLHAQKPDLYWGVDMSALFDNREGDEKFADAKTFFQTQLAPEIGLTLDKKRHLVAAGAVWTQPIGCEWDGHRISPPSITDIKTKACGSLSGCLAGISSIPRCLITYGTTR